MNFFLTGPHKFLRLVPKVMLQKLIKRMLSSILIHKLCKIFGEVCGREPGKQCLPKWYIENIKDYIPLMLCIGLVLDSKNIQFHIICSFYYSIPTQIHCIIGTVKPKNIVNRMKTKKLFKALFINSISKIKILFLF